MSALGAPGCTLVHTAAPRAGGPRRFRGLRSRAVRAHGQDDRETAPANSGDGHRVATRRHVVVLCHDVSKETWAGLFTVSNLLQGRVDLWCRCVTASLYLSDALRRDVVVSLVLSRSWDGQTGHEGTEFSSRSSRRVIQIRGDEIQGLAPAESRVALLLQRAAQHASIDTLDTVLQRKATSSAETTSDSESESENIVDVVKNVKKSKRNAEQRAAGWLLKQPGSRGRVPGIYVHDYANFETCLGALLSLGGDKKEGGSPFFLLDVCGDSFGSALNELKEKKRSDPTSDVGCATLVLGDALGITTDERQVLSHANATPVTLGKKTLLASHCVVLAHAVLDAAADE